MATEIYLCRKGQPIKEGRLVYSDEIDDKHMARRDAEERCEDDNTIHKIAYYKMESGGGHKVFYTHTNPDAISVPQKSTGQKKIIKAGKQGARGSMLGGNGVTKKITNWLYDDE